jgi:hypothetical protein
VYYGASNLMPSIENSRQQVSGDLATFRTISATLQMNVIGAKILAYSIGLLFFVAFKTW